MDFEKDLGEPNVKLNWIKRGKKILKRKMNLRVKNRKSVFLKGKLFGEIGENIVLTSPQKLNQ